MVGETRSRIQARDFLKFSNNVAKICPRRLKILGNIETKHLFQVKAFLCTCKEKLSGVTFKIYWTMSEAPTLYLLK